MKDRALSSVHRQTIIRAAHLVGGVYALSARLGVPPSVIRRWMNGEARPPVHHFLAAVDIVSAAGAVRSASKPTEH